MSTRRCSAVRGLLAKAESTSLPEEAEALSAKAQELMTKYALIGCSSTPTPSSRICQGRRHPYRGAAGSGHRGHHRGIA
ncbi:DUF2786 domain-containing protein [Nocardia tengchongensis]|uniref:DUF2786 domain-containing protein n=1 Tax=Nocardia tengchongensis TaxID=2055889 RepID=UPI0036A6EA14